MHKTSSFDSVSHSPSTGSALNRFEEYLAWYHGKPPCRQTRAQLLHKYLRDYARCTLLLYDQQQAVDGSDSKDNSIKTNHKEKLKEMANSQIGGKLPIHVKVGKRLTIEAGLFNKGRRAIQRTENILERLVFQENKLINSHVGFNTKVKEKELDAKNCNIAEHSISPKNGSSSSSTNSAMKLSLHEFEQSTLPHLTTSSSVILAPNEYKNTLGKRICTQEEAIDDFSMEPCYGQYSQTIPPFIASANHLMQSGVGQDQQPFVFAPLMQNFSQAPSAMIVGEDDFDPFYNCNSKNCNNNKWYGPIKLT